MPFTTLISAAELAEHVDDATWVIVDCRFALDQPERGRQDYERAHIPGAVYAHLNDDLSGPIVPGKTGRHPLPAIEAAAHTFGRLGIGANTQVVAYDDNNGSIAARLWWLLRWLGHDQVAVLDGGWAHWQREARAERGGVETRRRSVFVPQPRPGLVASADDVARGAGDPAFRVIDSRSVERYRGENETIDSVAGHVPGAIAGPFVQNVDADGRFLPAPALAQRFDALLGDVAPAHAIFYCGSGVTAAHNLLALAHAGRGDAQLYAGSWSDWITDPARPIATGA